MVKKTVEKKEIPTLDQSNPNNPFKRFLVLGAVLQNRLQNVQPGDVIGAAYLGMEGEGNSAYHNYNVKLQRGVSAERLEMAELLTLRAEDITLLGATPLIGVVVEVGEFTTEFGTVQSITVCLDLKNIHPHQHEDAF